MPTATEANASFMFHLLQPEMMKEVLDAGYTPLLHQATKAVMQLVLSMGGDCGGLSMHTHDAMLLTQVRGFKLWVVAAPEGPLPSALLDLVHCYGYTLLGMLLRRCKAWW